MWFRSEQREHLPPRLFEQVLKPRVCILDYFYFGQDQRLRDESTAVSEQV